MDTMEIALVKEIMDKLERMATAMESMAKTNAELLEIQKEVVKENG
jgi:hypothetical protein